MLWRKLAKHLRIGRLVVRGLAATDLEFGNCDPHRPDLDVAIRIRDRRTAWKLAVRPDPYVGEAYMSGFLVIERGSLRDFLEICFLNFRGFAWTSRQSRLGRVARRLLRRLQRQNSRRKAQRNVAHHYDLSDDLYRRFLDADRQYSCAYISSPVVTRLPYPRCCRQLSAPGSGWRTSKFSVCITPRRRAIGSAGVPTSARL